MIKSKQYVTPFRGVLALAAIATLWGMMATPTAQGNEPAATLGEPVVIGEFAPDPLYRAGGARAVFVPQAQTVSPDGGITTSLPPWFVGTANVAGQWSETAWTGSAGAGSALKVPLAACFPYDDLVLEVEWSARGYAVVSVELREGPRARFTQRLEPGTAVAPARLLVPLGDWPDADLLVLRVEQGEVAVGRAALYVDMDGDGIDAAEEERAGTSDYSPDSDGDGISDALDANVNAPADGGRSAGPARGAEPDRPAVVMGIRCSFDQR